MSDYLDHVLNILMDFVKTHINLWITWYASDFKKLMSLKKLSESKLIADPVPTNQL